MSESLSLLLVEKLLALTVVLQTLELQKIRRAWTEAGVWRWSTLRRDYQKSHRLVRRLLAVLFQEHGFASILAFRLAAAVLVLITPPLGPLTTLLLAYLLISNLLISVRFRGAFNGGSDAMTSLGLFGVTLGRGFSAHGGLWFLALLVCLSYFISGCIKLSRQSWRNGRALEGFLQVSNYGVPLEVRTKLKAEPAVVRLLSWTILLFECSFPFALRNPHWALGYILTAVGFHLANFWLFGLNRFFWAWSVTYPALYFCSQA